MEQLKYDDTDFQTGDILVYHATRFWYSRFVEYFTDSKYCHVSMILKDPTYIHPDLKGIYILESGMEEFPDSEDGKYKLGVQIVPLKKVLEKYDGQIYYRKLN